MKLVDFIICDDVRQEVGGKVTIVGAYGDGLNVHVPKSEIAGRPALKLALLARMMFEKSEEKPDFFKIDFVQAGKDVAHVSGQISINSPDITFLNIISIMNQFVIPESGRMIFKMQFKRKERVLAECVPDYFLNISVQKDV